jgi:SAM-dependent methyltransferase
VANQQDPAFINAYAEALPLPDASVDVVASFHTFEHVHSVERTLREIRRVLAPGGMLFAQVPNYASLYEPHYGVLAPLGLGKTWMRYRLRLSGRPTSFLEHLQWLTPAELRMQLAQAGFSAVRVTHIPRRGSEHATIAASAAPLPFRFRRGAFVGRFARAIALLGDKLKISADWYPNIEIWAEA